MANQLQYHSIIVIDYLLAFVWVSLLYFIYFYLLQYIIKTSFCSLLFKTDNWLIICRSLLVLILKWSLYT